MSIMNGYQLNWFAPHRTEYKLSLKVVKSFPVWSLAIDMVWVFVYLNKLHNNESKSSTSCWRDPESRKTVLCLCSISRLFQPTSGFYRNVLSMWKWFTRQINTPHTQIHTHTCSVWPGVASTLHSVHFFLCAVRRLSSPDWLSLNWSNACESYCALISVVKLCLRPWSKHCFLSVCSSENIRLSLHRNRTAFHKPDINEITVEYRNES